MQGQKPYTRDEVNFEGEHWTRNHLGRGAGDEEVMLMTKGVMFSGIVMAITGLQERDRLGPLPAGRHVDLPLHQLPHQAAARVVVTVLWVHFPTNRVALQARRRCIYIVVESVRPPMFKVPSGARDPSYVLRQQQQLLHVLHSPSHHDAP
jgi:hypothetical protein